MTSPPPATGLLPDTVAQWVGATTGGALISARQLLTGNRRQSWIVETDDDGGRTLFLRMDPVDTDQDDDPFTIRRESRVYQALTGAFALIPGLVSVHPTLEVMLTEHVDGGSSYHALDLPNRIAVGRDFMRALATLHLLDPVPADFPSSASHDGSVASYIREELSRWEQIYRRTGRDDPLIELGLEWLLRNVPNVESRPAIIHGDAGPGNFLFQGDRVTALVDWEFAHIGDPMEDLAWLSMRSVFEGFEDFTTRIEEYEALVGSPVELGRIRFHRVSVQFKVAIIRHRANNDPNPTGDVANGLISRVTNRRLLLEALVDAQGSALPEPTLPEVPPSDQDWVYEATLRMLRNDVVDRTSDEYVVTKAKSIARLVKYLRAVDRHGSAFDQLELNALRSTVGDDIVDREEGRRRLSALIREGQFDAQALQYLTTESAIETRLMEPALGAIAGRHLPELPTRRQPVSS